MRYGGSGNWLVAGMIAGVLAHALPATTWAQAPDETTDQTAVTFGSEDNPLVTTPQTPLAQLEAVVLMLDLGRLDLAVTYFDLFQAGNVDDTTLQELRDQLGTATFIRLTKIAELQPEAGELLNRLSALSRQRAQDPAYIDGLIQTILDSPPQRELAIRELRGASTPAVPQVLKRLTDPDVLDRQELLIYALSRMGGAAIAPLVAAVEADDSNLQAAAISTLGWLRAEEAIPVLWYPAFGNNQNPAVQRSAREALARILYGTSAKTGLLQSSMAQEKLSAAAELAFFRRQDIQTDAEQNVTQWSWDSNTSTISERTISTQRYWLETSARRSRQALDLSPSNARLQEIQLAALLGLGSLDRSNSKDSPWEAGTAASLGLTAGEDLVGRALTISLEARQSAAAQGAIEVLGEIATPLQLKSGNSGSSPLISALYASDPRIPFAAAIALLRLEPSTTFRGSSQLLRTLVRGVRSEGRETALIIDADSQRASVSAGYLGDSGYEPTTARTGMEGFRLAAEGNYALIAIHINTIRWELTQTLANLRADPRTAYVPIVIYGPDNKELAVSSLIRKSQPAIYVTESSTPSDFISQIRPFLSNTPAESLRPEERLRMRSLAVYWLAHLAAQGNGQVFDLTPAEPALSEALEDPRLAANALIALGGIGTPSAQERLAEVALNNSMTPEVRVRACQQLSRHVQWHGVLFTRHDSLEWLSAWKNESDPRVQQAMATVVGSLRPSEEVVTKRLLEFSAPR